MRVVHLSYFAGKGGAWTAIDGLNKSLQAADVSSRILCATRAVGLDERADIATAGGNVFDSLARTIPILPELWQGPWMRGRWRDPALFSNWLPRCNVGAHPWVAEADVLHVQWIILGLATPEQLGRLSKPTVISLLDFWPITGGCSYTRGCRGFETRCGRCPHIESHFSHDVSRWNWHRKARAYRRCRPVFVALSRRMADDAARSAVTDGCRILTIPSGIDTETFCPDDPAASRTILNLPPDLPLILFGAQSPAEPRKGFDLLLDAVRRLHAARGATFGLGIYGTTTAIPWREIPVPAFDLGRLETPLRRHAYRAADVFVAPSREENFASTVLEAMASGCPAIAFDIGGMPDAIANGTTGFIVKPFETTDLAERIGTVLGDDDLRRRMGAASRARIETEFSITRCAQRHIDLYTEMTNQGPN